MVKYPDDITQKVIKDALTKGITELEFVKADGTIRKGIWKNGVLVESN